jgi:hypothetical protein
MKAREWVRASAALMVLGCGGSIIGQGDGGTGDASADGVGVDDGGVTACTAPGNLKLCGGQCGQACPVDKCPSTAQNPSPMGELGVCPSPGLGPSGLIDCKNCPDGNLCALPSERYQKPLPEAFVLFRCMVPAVAQMYALNGRKDLALYADRSTYTDAPLPPPPETCPRFPGLRLCGGACGYGVPPISVDTRGRSKRSRIRVGREPS